MTCQQLSATASPEAKSAAIEDAKSAVKRTFGERFDFDSIPEGDDEKSVALRTALQVKLWLDMQIAVAGIMDSALNAASKSAKPGVKQILEKKEGLFRKYMMGKRVNYAARTAISPDPYIEPNEIGIPHYL
eukprot:TRINITY_DN4274_c0_g2_i1.p2 TRINITY_DN4274_c0_g2~~TRINITY_DN4274_c0_g2_i1.p2  ORF type:complete len:131 (+),score=61.68 TRINITY_DN4274_c0_g2_i1:234-626(+)